MREEREISGRADLDTQPDLGRGRDARIDGKGRHVAANGAAFVEQGGHQRLEMRSGAGLVDQQRLGGAADAGAAQFGVDEDRAGHGEIGVAMDVDMIVAVEMGEDRHPRLGLHPFDQTSPAARHDDIDAAAKARQHFTHRRSVGHRNELDRGFRQAGGAQAPDETGMDRL